MKSSGPRIRRLSEEDIALWRVVAASAKRLPGAHDPGPPPAPRKRVENESPLPEPLPVPAPSLKPLAPIDRREKRQVSRGKQPIDAAFDLHGMRLAEAERYLFSALSRAQRDGARIVLVVTGKGRNAQAEIGSFSSGEGVLKRHVPHWLSEPRLRSIVMGFEEAGRTHGGSGALYVRLRSR